MDVQLPDGTVVKDVPDGTSKLELFHKLRAANHPAANSLVKDLVRDYNSPDLEGVAWKAGAAVNDFANKFLPQKVAAGLGVGANMAVQAIPALLGGQVAGEAKTLTDPVAKGLMKSALKPSVLEPQKGAKAVETLLNEGINPTNAGVDVLKSKIAGLENEIQTALKGSAGTINRNVVASRLSQVMDEALKGPNPQGDMKAIEEVWNNFLAHPNFAGKTGMTPSEANQMKSAIYRGLGDAGYKLGLKPAAERDALKALASSLKQEVGDVVPAVSEPLAKQSELINALKFADRAAARQGNLNPAGLALIAKNPEAGLGLLADRSAWAKAMAARGLYSGTPALGFAAGGALSPYLGRPPGALSQ